MRLRALADAPSAFGSTLAETQARPAEFWQHRAQAGSEGDQQVLFVAENNDGLVGMAGGMSETDDFVPELISMWVDPRVRGTGLGRQLVAAIVDWARRRGARALQLWVTESNKAAVALYEQSGFQRTGERQPLPSNERLAEIRMLKPLS